MKAASPVSCTASTQAKNTRASRGRSGTFRSFSMGQTGTFPLLRKLKLRSVSCELGAADSSRAHTAAAVAGGFLNKVPVSVANGNLQISSSFHSFEQKRNSQAAAVLPSCLVHSMSGEKSAMLSLQEVLTMQLDEVQCAVRATSITLAVQLQQYWCT